MKDYKQPGKRNEEGEFQEPEAPSMNALPPVIGGMCDVSYANPVSSF